MRRSRDNQFKILMSTDTLGGVWTYALELINALKNYDVQIVLATMGRPLNNHQRAQVRQLKNAEVEESNFKLEWMDRPWEDVRRAGDWLLELEKKHKPDLIHLNNYVHASLSFRSPILIIAHSDIYSWWKAVNGEPPPGRYDMYIRKVTQGLESADYIIAPTSSMLKCINECYGIFKNQKVIANARDPQKFKPGKKKPYILSIGRLWDEAKNIQLLEKAADSLVWPVFIAGEDRHPDHFSTGRFNRVHFLGKLSEQEVAEWLSKASIYVMPAKYEPFGLSVLEAALSSCALILGDIESFRENWDDAAFFIDPDKTVSLEKKIFMLQKDPSFRTALARAAYFRAKRFTPEKMVSKYMKVYYKLLERSGKKHQIA